MRHRDHVSRIAAIALGAVLAGCGGGGGSGTAGTETGGGSTAPTTAPQPAAPLSAYLGHGEGGIGTVTLQVGSNGVFKIDTDTVTLQDTGTGTCSVRTEPADPEGGVCNRFADGKAYLFCPDGTGTTFDAVLFKQADFQAATAAELAGQTLHGRSCGATGLRELGNFTLAISADGQSATEVRENSTWTYSASAMAEAAGQSNTPGHYQRWAIYKIPAGGGTQYFVASLWEAARQDVQALPPNLYFLQK